MRLDGYDYKPFFFALDYKDLSYIYFIKTQDLYLMTSFKAKVKCYEKSFS